MWKIAAQADLSSRSRLTEQKEHTGPRCPYWSVLRTRLSVTHGGFGFDALAGWGITHTSNSRTGADLPGAEGGTGREWSP